jgi:hypothetical protein
VQSLPTEAKPLSACSQCGTALPPPTGSATFVYGVGPVGYQSCATCGAKWRYLWQDPPGASGGLNRLPFLLVGVSVVVLLALGAFALLRGSTAYSAKEASAGTTTPTTGGGATSTTSDKPTASAAAFTDAMSTVDTARPKFVDYLTNDAPSSQQADVNDRLTDFVRTAQTNVDALKDANWPANAQADVDRLIEASQQFISDVDLAQYGLQYSTSYLNQLATDSHSIQRYEAAVKAELARS